VSRWKRFVRWLRWGRVRWRTTQDINGTAAEIEYTDRFGRVIGYWAYGSFDPQLPYQGD